MTPRVRLRAYLCLYFVFFGSGLFVPARGGVRVCLELSTSLCVDTRTRRYEWIANLNDVRSYLHFGKSISGEREI